MMIVGLVAAGILTVYGSSVRTFADQDNRIKSQDSGRAAMDTISRYIREGTSSASNLTSVSDTIAYAQPQELVLYSNVDTDNTAEKIRFYVSGSSVMLQKADPIMTNNPPTYPTTYATNGTLVITGLTNGATPIFTYYAYSGSTDQLAQVTNPTTAADLASIVVVDIELQVNEKTGLSKGSVSLHTRIQIRQRYPYGL
jgi:Tfp pilus assembly protein PilW